MTKFLKISAIIFLSIFIIIAVLFSTYLIITKDAVLDKNKLIGAGQNIIIYDDAGNEIVSASLGAQKKSVSIKNLQPETINAFIASEDRTFYKHKGLNFKRMIKAAFKNIAAGSFKEGASTISQQLIKNTHLSNDKTIKRKLNEIRLTLQLERRYEKDEILEMYLNTIYFGHNCYGLQSAANFYFDKKAENLNLTESATIVGLLTSPNNYSPFKNPEKCLNRRNIVLKNMYDCGYIDEQTYNSSKNEPLNAKKSTVQNSCGEYIGAIFDELEEIDFDYYALTDGCIIKSYMNLDAQKFIEGLNYPCDNAVIITDNETGGVKAYKTTINGAKRQPGSTVKPIFVYAPAIEERQLNPLTKILDEKINYNGYSPENFDKQYHGYVSVTDCIKKSLNIPAVKTLNTLTLDKCEKYLTAMDIKLDDVEKNLSLALGGMKYGLSIKELADKYSIFPKGGYFRPSRFIKEIVSRSGKVLYSDNFVSSNVYSRGTCSLMNEMLIETSKSGTAKKLKNLPYDVASKTGTCGNSEGNTDAYAVSYTTENCIAIWLGDKDNKRTEITGGNHCCNLMKEIMEKLYSGHNPAALDTTSGTVEINLDKEEYAENNKFILADPLCPKLNILRARVLKGDVPLKQSDKFSSPTIQIPTISVEENTIKIKLCHAKYYSFLIKRNNNEENCVIYDGVWKNEVIDTPPDGIYTYTVTPYFEHDGIKIYGKTITLPTVNLSKDANKEKIPDIIYKDWFNQ